jgi:hypothetical protein
MNYIQIENLIGNSLLARLYNLAKSNNFPWYFLSEDISVGSKVNLLDEKFTKQKTLGFSHSLISENYESPYTSLFYPVLDDIQDYFDCPLNFFRVRLCLQLNNGNDFYNFPHTDHSFNHYSAIFYLHDSSGDTVFFDQHQDPTKEKLDNKNELDYLNQNYTINHRVTPKRNNLFIFNGNQYHSSSNPTTNQYRIILNINFTCESNIFEQTQENSAIYTN